MSVTISKNIIRWGIIVVSLYTVSLILWNTFIFFQQFKEEERLKMEIFGVAYQKLNSDDLDRDVTLERYILESITNIPMILTDADGNVIYNRNLGFKKEKDTLYLQKRLAEMKMHNKPIVVDYQGELTQYVYYSDSNIITKLKYFPLGLLLVLILFALALYLYSRNNRIAAQNRLWTGMAKETAHQIGTPLTSLMGWSTLLKDDEQTKATGIEMEKDIKRLEVIANRFSKIGSTPTLYHKDLVVFTNESMLYLKSRASNQVSFELKTSADVIMAHFNPELYGWVLENLIKNALDAMQGKGSITIEMEEDDKKAIIKITDTGKGIPKAQHKTIFNPGFTTKQRGWGLGLSLSKRIISDFHGGQIFVLRSEVNKGTCFQINLPKR